MPLIPVRSFARRAAPRVTTALAALATALTLTTPPAAAQHTAGAYLAVREARAARDYQAAARYLDQLLAVDPGNPATVESMVITQLVLGQFDQATGHALTLSQLEPDNRAATLLRMTNAFATQDYAEALRLAERGVEIHPLLDALSLAWAQVGAGSMSDALNTLDAMAGSDDMRPFALYCRALALALAGDAEGALAIFDDPSQPLRGALNRRGYLAWAQVLGLAERYEDGVSLLIETFANPEDPQVARLLTAFQNREAPAFDVITSPAEGMAEVFAVMAAAMTQVENTSEALIYARGALWLNPGLDDTRILVGEIFESLNQLSLAAQTYAEVPADSVFAMVAQIGQAQILHEQGRPDESLAILTAMERDNPRSVGASQVLGDYLRQIGEHAQAAQAYDRTFALLDELGLPPSWNMHFARAVAFERTGDWPRAEADFRAALAIEPEQATVLNYLGYSLVERREKLEEALAMIERAVEAEPNSGAIVDSLAWALFQLGRYDEALPQMERAIELLPTDPILNDHLGDVYWAVGREREARFQWSRALSFGPHPDLNDDTLRRKIDDGLDAVRAADGLPPLRPAGE